jgi:exodeoxyribonuclease VII large subunit
VEAEVIIGVAELARRLKRAVENTGGYTWIEGELGAVKAAASGHFYFSLKDEKEDACLECVMYRLNALRARRLLVDGARVQVRAKPGFWAPRGRVQLAVEAMRPLGRGALLEALEQLKTKLASEGLFAAEKKRPLPREPRVIGVVTSAAGAALHDIRTVAFRRGSVRLVLSPALVQGEGAPLSIVRALDLLERHPEIEVIVLGRGGGSAEDLMAFNDERVVRRVARCRVPVVSAVGHEVDTTLTDLVADVRAATPSQAAELVVPDTQARVENLTRLERALRRAVTGRLAEDRATLDRLSHRLGDPRFALAERQQDLDELHSRLERVGRRLVASRAQTLLQVRRRLEARHPRVVLARAKAALVPWRERLIGRVRLRLGAARSELAENAARLNALSPLSSLGRGYAIVIRENGSAVRQASDVEVGDTLRIRLHAGELGAQVTQVDTKGQTQASSELRSATRGGGPVGPTRDDEA